VLEALEAEEVLRRLDADAHLVPIVRAGIREPMDDRADRRPQDQPALGDLPRPQQVRLEAVLRVCRLGVAHGETPYPRSPTAGRAFNPAGRGS
jgi:hypothetical protein